MDDFGAARGTPEFGRLKELLSNRAWRLDNLYTIRDEQGTEVPFKRNEAQRAYFAAQHSRDVIPKARKLGMSTGIGVFMTDTCIFRSGTFGAIVDETQAKAEEKLDICKLAYDRLPAPIKAARPLANSNTEEIVWQNGSKIQAGISARGGTPQMLHVSEFGKVAVDRPKVAREIRTGSIQAVPLTGWVGVESTAHGTSGDFYDMVEQAKNAGLAGRQLTALDFKLHFFGWWIKREYRLPNNLVVIPPELRLYFTELEVKHGIKLDADQMAWYATQFKFLGPDDVKSEFPSTVDELFFNSVLGAYWKKELTKARREGRIGGMVPHDPSRRVNTAWDIGEDGTVVIYHQTDGVRHRIIDYFEEEGGSLQSAAADVSQKASERGFIYEKHYGPHDIDHRVWAHKAKTRKEIAKELGINFTVVPQVEDKADSIEAARRFINLMWVDHEHCQRFEQGCDNYRKGWNKALNLFKAEPIHDWASHIADALQTLAMGIEPEKPDRESRRRFSQPKKTSAWAA